MNQVRIAINNDMQKALDVFKRGRYKFLSYADIFKLSFSKLFFDEVNANKEIIEVLDKKAAKAVATSLKQIDRGEYDVYDNVDDLMKDLNS